MKPFAIIFDLDGTLIDTAPDMVAALNRLLAEQSAPPVPYAVARNQVSNGAVGLIRLGLGAQAAEDPQLRQRYLDIYAGNICNKSHFFNGLDIFFNILSNTALPWGIVTNKPGWLTEPLLAQLRPHPQPGCVVSGDALPQRKPHPAPLLLAASQLGVAPAHCLYVGDARRDIQAGLAAGMQTAAASYGYIAPEEDLHSWQAHWILNRPDDLARCISAL